MTNTDTYTYATMYFHFGWDRQAFIDLPALAYFILTPEEAYEAQKCDEITSVAGERQIIVTTPTTVDDLAMMFQPHAAIVDLGGAKFVGNTDSAIAQDIIIRFAQLMDMLGNDVEDSFIGYEHVKANEGYINASSRSSDLRGLGAGKVALCVASGPTVARHLDALRRLQHTCTIIAADSILEGLLKHGIRPHFVTALERGHAIPEMLRPAAGHCDTHLVALPVVRPEVYEMFAWRTTVWWNADDLYRWMDPNEQQLVSGRSCGTLSVAVAGHMGFDDVWLVGHDLCYGETASHSELCNDIAKVHFETRNTEILGNDDKMHPSLFYWNAFRQDIEQITRIYPNTGYHNVNIDVGAKIGGMDSRMLPDAPKGEPVTTVPFTKHPPITSCVEVESNFPAIKNHMDAMAAIITDPARIDEYATALEVDDVLYQYVMRACMRNISLRMNYDNAQTSDEAQVRANTLYAQKRYATVASAYINAFKNRL